MHKSGDCVLDHIYEMGRLINENCDKKEKIIIIKSTVPPGTTRGLHWVYPFHNWIMNPEFLTARSARLDFINSSRIVIGGNAPDDPAVVEVAKLYRNRFPATPIYQTVWEAAELVKYMNNCFFALKISYLNEIYTICEKHGLPYNDLKVMFMADGRIGNSHLDVPGFDGDRGFGGTCFPKDISAFCKWAQENGTPVRTLEAAMEVNRVVRKKKDWEVVG
jgi:UDPglucose 6-dehydrogenase